MVAKAQSAAIPSGMLSPMERLALIVPLLGGTVFGLLPFLLGGMFGSVLGYPGNDSFAYRLGGAATFGYAVALALGLRQDNWAPLRLVIIATLTFNLASLFACVAAIAAGSANVVVYLILMTSILIVAITATLLNRYKAAPRATPDLSQNQIRGLALGTVLSGAFGLMGLFIPVIVAQLFGFKGTDVFLYRQAGAASLGYAVMAIYAARSGAWSEVRLPFVMAFVFNGLSLIGSVIALAAGDPPLLVVVVGLVSFLVTVGTGITLQRGGK